MATDFKLKNDRICKCKEVIDIDDINRQAATGEFIHSGNEA